MRQSRDEFGDRMKMYERMETGRSFMPGLPIYVRLDGKCFHNFTKGLERPFDEPMRRAMADVTKYLVDETNAVFGYTQSDEISLIYYTDSYKSQVFMNGKIQKMVSILAAMCTARFNQIAVELWPNKFEGNYNIPVFDCRAFTLPSKTEAMNAILWRVKDAVKNSVSMAASCYYSPNQLEGKSESERQDLLMERGVNWNDYPRIYKEGSFIQRRKVVKVLSDKELERIPEQHRPTGPVERSCVVELDLPRFGSITNRVELIFEGAEPLVADDVETIEAGC